MNGVVGSGELFSHMRFMTLGCTIKQVPGASRIVPEAAAQVWLRENAPELLEVGRVPRREEVKHGKEAHLLQCVWREFVRAFSWQSLSPSFVAFSRLKRPRQDLQPCSASILL